MKRHHVLYGIGPPYSGRDDVHAVPRKGEDGGTIIGDWGISIPPALEAGDSEGSTRIPDSYFHGVLADGLVNRRRKPKTGWSHS